MTIKERIPIIQVSHLNVKYQETTVIQDLSFTVYQGECVGILGSSGKGKTTLLNVLTGLKKEWTGSILIKGVPLKDIPKKTLFKWQQVIMQNPVITLHPYLTIAENVWPQFTIEKIITRLWQQSNQTYQRKINNIFKMLDLDPSILSLYPHQLSGGQCQRVVIAIAALLTHTPEILYLDEPTSALDISVQAEILNLLKDIQTQKNLTYLLISHDPDVLNFMCHRTVSL